MKGMTLLLAIAGAAFPSVVGYHVDPTQASWSGWTGHQTPYNRVSEIVTCCWDSLAYVELFAGDSGSTGGGYRVGVWDGDVELTRADGTQHQPTSWVKVENWSSQVAFTKGKEYEFRFTRAGSDSTQHYYQGGNPYRHGYMRVGSANHADMDLCMRVYGRMNAVGSLDFGADEASWHVEGPSGPEPWPDRALLAARAESCNVRTVRLDFDWWLVQKNGWDSWDFTILDSSLQALGNWAGCRILGLLARVPRWASTRWDTVTHRWSEGCPPRGLQHAFNDSANYLGRFLIATVQHCDNSGFVIHDWEVLNEVNSEDTSGKTTSSWQHPNRYRYYTDTLHVGPGLHDMCSLYVGMAQVTAQAIRSVSGHQSDRIAVNSVNWVNAPDESAPRYSGKEWLREFYDIVRRKGIPQFWDAISAHPYQETLPGPPATWPFGPSEFEAHAETLRNIMREHGDYGELWNTEFSMPGLCWWMPETSVYYRYTVATPKQDADYCCEMFTTAEGMKGLPDGAFDRNYWWFLRQPPLWGWGCWGLMDSALNVHPSYYAFKQTAEQLTGKRLNGRVTDGDTAIDNHVRIYEFEDTGGKRTWVCWKDGDTGRGVGVKLPVRANSLIAEPLAYGRTTSRYSSTVSNDGWLSLNLSPRSVFISEKTPPMRPDLRVDSVRVGRTSPVTIRTWVTNHGTRATPVRSGSRVPYPTWAVLSANGDSLAQQVRPTAIAVNQQAEFTFDLGQTELPDTVLLSFTVNPKQTYVELGTDDNTGYSLLVKP